MNTKPSEPELLRLGRVFEDLFREQFLATGGFEADVAVVKHCQVVRSRGTERSQMLDGQGEPTFDPEKSVSFKTVKPIVVRGFGSVDLMVFYIDDDGFQCHVVIEVKNTTWDTTPPGEIVKRLGSHRRQVYGYLEPLEYRARRREIGRPQAILVYKRRPKSIEMHDVLEEYLGGYGIQIVYKEELLERQPLSELHERDKRQQAWLRESPACQICSEGAVLIRQHPSPRFEALDLARRHSEVCPGSNPA